MAKQADLSYQFQSGQNQFTWRDDPVDFLGFDDEDRPFFANADLFTKLCVSDSKANRASQIESILAAMQAGAVETKDFEISYGLRPRFDRRSAQTHVHETGKITWLESGEYEIDGKISLIHALADVAPDQPSEINFFDLSDQEIDRSRFLGILSDTLDRLQNAKPSDELDHSSAGLFAISIDRLDQINEIYGFQVANDALAAIMDRLNKFLRSDDVVGRLNSNMIGIITPGSSANQLMEIGNRLLRALKPEAVNTRAGPLITTLSIGAMPLGIETFELNETVSCLEEALRNARKENRNAINVYEDHIQKLTLRHHNLDLANRIVRCLNQNEFFLQSQVIVDSENQEPIFEEALIRIREEDGSILLPGTFLSVVARLGLTRLIDIRALELALVYLKDNPEKIMSVNIAPETIGDPDWEQRIAAAAVAKPEILTRLIVEITEISAVERLNETVAFIHNLHEVGTRVAIDDFGAGFMSFGTLKQLELDVIKLDGSYGVGLADNRVNQAFVRCLVELSHELDMDIVLEWIGNPEDATVAQKLGVDFLQGNYFGRPIDLAAQQEQQFSGKRNRHLQIV